MFALSAKVQSILFSADFSAGNDPNVRQFTTIAEDICNGGEGFPDELICPHGLGFFASSIDVAAVDPGRTFIGPPILNGARQSYVLWDGTDPAGTFTEDAWDVFVATVAWTVTDKNPADSTIRWATYSEDFANGVITVAPDPVDAEVISRLEAVGYNVVPTWQCCGDEQTNFTSLMPLNVNASDLDILSEHAQVLHHPQWLGSPIPLMMWQGSITGDIGVSNRNTIDKLPGTGQPWEVSITASGEGHPAMAGKTGTFQWTNTLVGLTDVGTAPAPGATVPLTFALPYPRLLENLAEAESLIARILNSDVQVPRTINAADFLETGGVNPSEVGRWFPGDPPEIGATTILNNDITGLSTDDSFAIRTMGTLNVSSGPTQTFSFAISKAERADGGTLVIDGQTMIIDDGSSVLDSFGQIELSSGDHTLEWISYHKDTNPTAPPVIRNNASFELSVSEIPDNSGAPTLNNFWEVVGDEFSTNSRISLVPFDGAGVLGELQNEAFRLDEPGTPRDFPAMLLFEEVAEMKGGGITNFVEPYFGMVDYNHDWSEGFLGSDFVNNRRQMLFDPIDTMAAGSDPINLSFLLAATPGGFEPSGDTFEVWVDPENDGSFL